ncbi:Probable cell division protein RodA [Mycobacteroides abscessus subsp. massiliense]|nr:Probable cell division protein RodA [Mycobacteroides abscessus subsp. massiliense]
MSNYVLLAILLRISHIARRPLTTTSAPNAAPIAEARTELIDRV